MNTAENTKLNLILEGVRDNLEAALAGLDDTDLVKPEDEGLDSIYLETQTALALLKKYQKQL